jgi:transcriptional regulator with XRE-family HTH domain
VPDGVGSGLAPKEYGVVDAWVTTSEGLDDDQAGVSYLFRRPGQPLGELTSIHLEEPLISQRDVMHTECVQLHLVIAIWFAKFRGGDLSYRSSPTTRRRRLGLELRRLREAADLTGDDVAKRLGWSVSKVSRIEKARAAVPWSDVSDLLDVYGVDGETRAALIQLCKDSKQQAWWQSYNDVLASFKNLANYIDLESAASALSIYTPLTVPGLLQSEDYARAVIATARPLELREEEIERRVELRLRRQTVMAKDPPLRLWAIMDEAALHREVGGRDVMRRQLQHLAAIARRPEITLQVVPYSAGGHVAMTGEFSIFSFPDDPDVLALEAITGTLYLDRRNDIGRATLCFDHLRSTAHTAVDSVALINEIAQSYR